MVRAAEVSVQPVLSGRQVSGGGGAGGRREELHGGGVVVVAGAGAGVHPWTAETDRSLNAATGSCIKSRYTYENELHLEKEKTLTWLKHRVYFLFNLFQLSGE